MSKKIVSRSALYYLLCITSLLFISKLAISVDNEIIYSGPGDNKDGYESRDYVTKSLSINERKGEKTNLIKYAEQSQLGLPKLKIPKNNPITEKKIALGKKLFFDRRISLNNTMSCAMCHIPEQGFTNNEIRTAVGIEGRSNLRNAPTIINSAYYKFLFHDAREYSLENQVWQPVLKHSEMGMPSFGFTVKKLELIPGYKNLFNDAFPGEGINVATFSKAIASYERSLISANSNFDKWYFGKNDKAVSAEVKKGFEVFIGKGNCVSCHSIDNDHALFFDNKLHNTGVGYADSMGLLIKNNKTVVQLAPGEYVEVDNNIIKSVNQQKKKNDLGLYDITENPDHRWMFKTPSLRNISLTSPYMHNGVFSSLDDVINFYNDGGVQNELLSPKIKKLNLSKAEKINLKLFLESLVGENINILIADALFQTVGDLTKDDPNWANDKDMGYNK
ncbi:MAG: methylamine utilization protein MauG [Gammaproteobacteria bacterium]|jgi:cytochrome c peroxidase|nr:methylamine utilization protein MauG [Gammaproteobacteria bacterium]MBT7603329.1 methylamine utilization protein MauG [Gammaproteobacteria bacterium]